MRTCVCMCVCDANAGVPAGTISTPIHTRDLRLAVQSTCAPIYSCLHITPSSGRPCTMCTPQPAWVLAPVQALNGSLNVPVVYAAGARDEVVATLLASSALYTAGGSSFGLPAVTYWAPTSVVVVWAEFLESCASSYSFARSRVSTTITYAVIVQRTASGAPVVVAVAEQGRFQLGPQWVRVANVTLVQNVCEPFQLVVTGTSSTGYNASVTSAVVRPVCDPTVSGSSATLGSGCSKVADSLQIVADVQVGRGGGVVVANVSHVRQRVPCDGAKACLARSARWLVSARVAHRKTVLVAYRI